jgi:hypothetical protein
MDIVLFKFVIADIQVWIITITIYITFREPNKPAPNTAALETGSVWA